MNAITVDAHFGLTAAPDSKDIKLDPGARRLILDVLELTGGASPTLQVTATEIHESTREVQVISNDARALDDFTPGRTVRGSQSGARAIVTSQRTASGITYLNYATGGKSNFFKGEDIQEVGLTGNAVAAIAIVDSSPTQAWIESEEVAATTAVSADTVPDISEAKRDAPQPYRPRTVRLGYEIVGSPSSASFLVRVA